MFDNASPDMTFMRKLNLVFRFSYTLPFVLSSVVGLVMALGCGAPAYVYICIPLSVMFLGVFVNFSNDYFDHGSGIDTARFEKAKDSIQGTDEVLQKLYWDGNQFDNGNVSVKEGQRLMVLIVALAIICALPVILYKPVLTIIFGAIGLFCAYFYTAPPINFGGRGLGEALVTVSFFMLCFCPYYLLTETFSTEVVLVALIVAITVGLMRAVDSMTAQEVHIEIGEKSIATMFGMDTVAKLVKVVIVAAYAIAVVLAVMFSPVYLVEFLTLPIAVKAWKTVTVKEPKWEFTAAPETFGLAVFSQIMMIIAAAVLYFI